MERIQISLLYDRHWLVTAVGDDMSYRSAGFAKVFDLHINFAFFSFPKESPVAKLRRPVSLRNFPLRSIDRISFPSTLAW
jgi:hypothetical protein